MYEFLFRVRENIQSLVVMILNAVMITPCTITSNNHVYAH